MEQAILIIHVLTALGIVGLILIQQGKGAEMGASFGAGGSQTLFGSGGGGSVLTRSTAILATIFFVTSLSLAWVAKTQARGVDAIDSPITTPALQESRGVAPVVNEQPPMLSDEQAPVMPAEPAADEIPVLGQ